MVKIVGLRRGQKWEGGAAVGVQGHRDDEGVPRPRGDHVGPAQNGTHTRGQQVRNKMLCKEQHQESCFLYDIPMYLGIVMAKCAVFYK